MHPLVVGSIVFGVVVVVVRLWSSDTDPLDRAITVLLSASVIRSMAFSFATADLTTTAWWAAVLVPICGTTAAMSHVAATAGLLLMVWHASRRPIPVRALALSCLGSVFAATYFVAVQPDSASVLTEPGSASAGYWCCLAPMTLWSGYAAFRLCVGRLRQRQTRAERILYCVLLGSLVGWCSHLICSIALATWRDTAVLRYSDSRHTWPAPVSPAGSDFPQPTSFQRSCRLPAIWIPSSISWPELPATGPSPTNWFIGST
ncbi:hypothetical protein [Nocardia caishijiensis]|uniref:hypothetical protein n=1 Tax=Nocardia caishijiensis TaxID=184756 RepID=UPI000832AE8C|nr:hypothetical protein [Nocardia caishijiensis]